MTTLKKGSLLILVAGASLLVGFSPRSFCQTVTVASGELTKRMWVASAGYTFDQNQDDATLVVLGDLLEAAGVDIGSVLQKNALPSAKGRARKMARARAFSSGRKSAQTTLTKDQAEKIIAAIQGILANNQTPTTCYLTRDEKLNALFDFVDKSAGGLPNNLGPGIQAANVLMRTAVQAMDRAFASQADQQGQVQFADQPLPLMSQDAQLQQTVLEQIYDLSQNNPDIAASVNDLLASNLGAPIGADIPTILQDNPNFASTPVIQYFEQNGLSNQQLTLDLGSLENTFTQSLSDLQSSVFDNALPLIQNINQNELTVYGTLEDYIAQANDRANNTAQAQQQQQAQQLQLDASKQGVYLLSTFVGFVNPQLGHDMSVVGNAAIQVNQAISNYTLPAAAVDTSSVFGNLTGGSLGAVIFTGNLVGAAMQVASIFQNNPSPDQIIFQELQQISAQITNLQNNMNERFNRLDGKLDELCGQVATILNTLNQVGTQVSQVQTQLYALQTQVGRLESEIHTWLSESDRLPFQVTINNVIGYQARTGQRLPFADYNAAESQLYTGAQQFCSSNTLAGDDYSANSIPFSELTQTAQGSGQISGVPFADKINWLAQFVLLGLGWPFPIPPRLCNPNDYAFFSNAYAELVIENADYASQEPGAVARILAVLGTGQQLQSVLSGLAYQPLFLDPANGLTAYYRRKRDALKQQIQGFEASFVGNNLPPRVSLWGDSNQVLPYVPSVSSMATCDGAVPGLQVQPGNVFYAIPAPVLNADYILQNHGNSSNTAFSLCLSGSWIDWVGPNLPHLLMVISVSYQGAPVVTLSKESDQLFCTTCGDNITPDLVISLYWNQGLMNQFSEYATVSVSSPNPQTLSAAAAAVDQALQNWRSMFYSAVSASFTQGGAIQSAADDLTGAKLLLDAYLALGLPRTLEGIDFIRYLSYGGQQNAQTVFLGGPDPNNPNNTSTIQNVYATASPQPPDLDIAVPTEARLTALESTLTARFNQINAGTFVESQRLVTRTLSNLQQLLPVGVVSSSVLAFPPQPVGTTSAPLTLTLTNLGGLPLTITSISLSPGFTQTNTCNGSITGDQNCTISVTCTPSAVSNGGTMTISAQGTTQLVNLSCPGTDFSLASSSPSVSISAGQQGTFPLSITPVGGFDQPIVFNCAWPKGQPQGTSCTFTPGTITPDGTDVATATAIIGTTATTASILRPDRGWRPTSSRPSVWAQVFSASWPLALAMLACLVAPRRRRLGLAGTMVLSLALMVACGIPRRSTSTGQSGSTPPGSYTITVTATCGGLSRQANLTLNVK